MDENSRFEFLKKVEFNLIWNALLNGLYLLLLLHVSGAAPHLIQLQGGSFDKLSLATFLAFGHLFVVSYVLVLMEIFLVYRSGIFYISYYSYKWLRNKHYYLDALKELIAQLPQQEIRTDRLPNRAREYEELYSSLKKYTLRQYYDVEGITHNPINMHFMWLITWETTLFIVIRPLMPEAYWPYYNFSQTLILAALLFVGTYLMDKNSARQEFNLFNAHRDEITEALKQRFKK